jgi:hypothetical protein
LIEQNYIRFKDFLDKINAEGGADVTEGSKGGLYRVINLNWKSFTKNRYNKIVSAQLSR